jgi:hypothetical protein
VVEVIEKVTHYQGGPVSKGPIESTSYLLNQRSKSCMPVSTPRPHDGCRRRGASRFGMLQAVERAAGLVHAGKQVTSLRAPSACESGRLQCKKRSKSIYRKFEKPVEVYVCVYHSVCVCVCVRARACVRARMRACFCVEVCTNLFQAWSLILWGFAIIRVFKRVVNVEGHGHVEASRLLVGVADRH